MDLEHLDLDEHSSSPCEPTRCFNAVLVNRYRSGRDWVDWHSDDEPRLGVEPLIASVSLGAARQFTLRRKSDGRKLDFDLQPGDVLVMAGRCQSEWQHTLRKTARPAGERLNLTFRRYELG